MLKPCARIFSLAALLVAGCPSVPSPPPAPSLLSDDDDSAADDDDSAADDDDSAADDDDSAADDDDTSAPCVRVDSDGDGSFDDDAVIVPLPPGVYGPEVEHALFHGTGQGSGYLYNVGDVGGDGSDDFLLTAGGNMLSSHHDYVLHGPFTARSCPISQAGAVISNNLTGGTPRHRGGGLGDLNGDGVPDIRILGNVYYGPVLGEVTAPDLSLGFTPLSAVAARLDDDGEIDLVSGNPTYDQGRGAVSLFTGPITSATDLVDPEILVGVWPADWLGMAMVLVHTGEGRDVVVVSGWNLWGGVYVFDPWPGPGAVSAAQLLALPQMDPVHERMVTDGAERLCVASEWTARCGTLEELAQGGGLTIDENPAVSGRFAFSQVAATTNYTAVAELGLGGYVRVFGPTPQDYWEFTSLPGPTAFGQGLALSENTDGDYVWLAVSAPFETVSVGAVHVYALQRSAAGR